MFAVAHISTEGEMPADRLNVLLFGEVESDVLILHLFLEKHGCRAPLRAGQ